MIRRKIKRKKTQNLEEIKENQNQGKLIIDGTCAPADISYPKDLHLLNQGRTKTEKIIDIVILNKDEISSGTIITNNFQIEMYL